MPNRVRVLIVDDIPANLLALEVVLEPLGCEIVRANSGKEALEKLEDVDFACIILDYFMPVMDGMATARKIRERSATRRIPIIFMTAGEVDPATVGRSYQGGAVDFLQKPFDPEALRAKVGVFIELFRQAEQLRHDRILADRRLINVLDTLGDGFLALDREWRFIHINRWAASLVDREPEDLIGQNIWEQFPHLLNTEAERNYRKAMEDQLAVRFEMIGRGERWYEIAVYPSPEGLLVYGRDITESRRLEHAREAAEARLRLALQSARMVAWEWDLSEGTVAGSEGIELFIGARSAQATDLKQLVHSEDLPSVLEALETAVEHSGECDLECRILLPDGSIRWIYTHGRVMDGGTSSSRRFSGISMDVTERREVMNEIRRLNAELVVARDQALQASNAKSTFLANMSHELRSPLNAICGYAEMIEEELRAKGIKNLAEDAAKITFAGKHLTSIVSDILDLAKIEAGKMELTLEEFDPSDVVQEAIAVTEPLVQIGGNTISTECHAHLGTVHADKTKLRQIVVNLLSNAAKFCENGKITVICNRRATDNGEMVEIGIQDTGIGIPKEQLDRLFQKFEQLDTSQTRKYGGTGLGLVISQLMAEMMGGSIEVHSEVGSGSTFTVLMPFKVRPATLNIIGTPSPL